MTEENKEIETFQESPSVILFSDGDSELKSFIE